MPIDLTKSDAKAGKIVFEWVVREYEKYDRDRRWYIASGILGVALLAYAVLSGNYLFALIIALAGIILFVEDMQEPLSVSFAITETGIILGKKFYRYGELKDFWIIYNPPAVKNLYFGLNGLVRHRLQVALGDVDPRPVRDYLSQFLSEDLTQEEEPASERIARMFKI